MLELNASLTRFYLTGNKFGAAGSCAIFGALERNRTVRNVAYGCEAPMFLLCVLGRGGWGKGMIVQGLAACKCALFELLYDCSTPSDEEIGVDGAHALGRALRANTTLTELRVMRSEAALHTHRF